MDRGRVPRAYSSFLLPYHKEQRVYVCLNWVSAGLRAECRRLQTLWPADWALHWSRILFCACASAAEPALTSAQSAPSAHSSAAARRNHPSP